MGFVSYLNILQKGKTLCNLKISYIKNVFKNIKQKMERFMPKDEKNRVMGTHGITADYKKIKWQKIQFTGKTIPY